MLKVLSTYLKFPHITKAKLGQKNNGFQMLSKDFCRKFQLNPINNS